MSTWGHSLTEGAGRFLGSVVRGLPEWVDENKYELVSLVGLGFAFQGAYRDIQDGMIKEERRRELGHIIKTRHEEQFNSLCIMQHKPRFFKRNVYKDSTGKYVKNNTTCQKLQTTLDQMEVTLSKPQRPVPCHFLLGEVASKVTDVGIEMLRVLVISTWNIEDEQSLLELWRGGTTNQRLMMLGVGCVYVSVARNTIRTLSSAMSGLFSRSTEEAE